MDQILRAIGPDAARGHSLPTPDLGGQESLNVPEQEESLLSGTQENKEIVSVKKQVPRKEAILWPHLRKRDASAPSLAKGSLEHHEGSLFPGSPSIHREEQAALSPGSKGLCQELLPY